MRIWPCLVLLLVVPGAFAAGELNLAADGRTDYAIVTAAAPSAADATAAKELKQHLDAATGADFPVLTDDRVGNRTKLLVVGASAVLSKLAPGLDLAALGHDGIVLQTKGEAILLAGRAPRGTLYAVYTFLEDQVGCRWWTSTESTVPKRATLTVPALDQRYAPAIRCREAFYRDAQENAYSARNKLNGHFHRVTPAYGGHYSILGWCHTFDQLLPPGKYFQDHPEWYSLINGKRQAEGAQLCLTNEAMRRELVKNALGWIRKEPTAGMISIAQNDCAGNCQCSDCQAIEKAEGAPSGLLIRFVNQVAEEIGKEYPDFLIETLAYQYTRKPPKSIRPRANVVVRLCTIECSYAQPLMTGKHNETFRNDLLGWAAIAPKLYVWDYVTNFANYLLPHPNYQVLAENIRTFAANKAIGLFEQGDCYSTTGDFVRLRAWVLAHLMWDPSRDQAALTDEFLRGYYGAAAPYLKQYLDLLTKTVVEKNTYLRCYMNDTSAWMTLAVANQATRLFNQAQQAVADDAVLAKRVRRERLPLDLVWLERRGAFRRRSAGDAVEYLGPPDPAAAFAEYRRLLGEHGCQFYGEGRPVAPYLDGLATRFTPTGPPPEQCRNLPEDDWVDAQEGLLTLHGLGSWVKVADDPLASNGKAAVMPGSHTQWAVQWPLGDDMDEGSKWRCYIVARCEAKEKAGQAFQIGLWDGRDAKPLAGRMVTIEEAGQGKYVVLDLGAHKLHGGCYLWVAPLNNPAAVTSVLVDRMFVVREK